MRLDHLVERQALTIRVAPGLAGPALLDRLAEINRRRFVPVLSDVLDEFDTPGMLVRIERLSVPLGSFAPDDLDRAAPVLRARLRRALADALHGPTGAVPEREDRARVAAFEHYLLHGAWPAARAIPLSLRPETVLARLVAEDPLALVAMLRRHGTREMMLARLVRQMPEALLAALLHRLEPVHAAYVLAYLGEVRESHAAERLVSASPAELGAMLWTIVLRDALQQSGLQANRKAFLRRLLVQLARSGGTTLAALIAQLRRGLPRILAKRRAPGSLVAVLGELIDEEPALLAGQAGVAELAALLARPVLSPRQRREARRLVAAIEGPRLRSLLRRLAHDDPARLSASIRDFLPLATALATLWNVEPSELPTTLETIAADDRERAALLALAAQSESQAGQAASRAGTLLAQMRGLPPGSLTVRLGQATAYFGAERPEPLAALAAALTDPSESPAHATGTPIETLLARARVIDAFAVRHLLRDLAAADLPRLCARLAPDAPEQLAAHLLAPHLHAAMTAFARAAGASPTEWQILLEAAARSGEGDLPDALLDRATVSLAHARNISPAALRARLQAALRGASSPERRLLAALRHPPRHRVDRLAAGHAAIEHFALLWDIAPEARAAALAARLPHLSALAPPVLCARLRTFPAADLNRVVAALPRVGQIRLALLLGVARSELQRSTGAISEVVARHLRGPHGQEGDSASHMQPSPPRSADGTQGRTETKRPARLHSVTMAQEETSRPRAARATSPAPAERRSILDLPHASASAAMALPAQRLGHRVYKVTARHLAALLHACPFAALRTLAATEDAPAHLAALLDAPHTAPLLFAAMPPGERERATALVRALTGYRGRLAVAPAKLARALVLAASARDWRSAGAIGFADAWLKQLLSLASLSEQAALRRLLSDRAPGQASEVRLDKAGDVPRTAPLLDRARSLLGLAANGTASAVRRALEQARNRSRLTHALGEAELVALLAILAPTAAAALLHAADRLAGVRRAAASPLPRAAQWDCILAAATSAHPILQLARRMLDGSEAAPALPPPLRARVEALLSSALEGMRDAPLRIALDLRARERDRRAAETRPADAEDMPMTLAIANAGLVLASAFLPRLFQSLDYVEPQGEGWRWRDPGLQARAVHLLQWLVDERSDAPEPQLALNKILCGMAPAEPVALEITPTEAELQTAQSLLRAMLANWPALGESSVAALRETFFRRDGRLTRSDSGWRLDVETRVLDILLDQLPWSFATILHPWMPAPLTVQWR